MKSMMIALLGIFVSLNSFAGGASGGGGVRPSMSFKSNTNIDIAPEISNLPELSPSELVKVIGMNEAGDVLFKYKRNFKDKSTIYQDNLGSVPSKYKKAIEASAQFNKWVIVPKE